MSAAIQDKSLGHFFARVLDEGNPDDIVFIDGVSRVHTRRGSLASLSRGVSHTVQSSGWCRAVLLARNSAALVGVAAGLVRAGVEVLSLDHTYGVDELRHFFSIFPPDVVFCSPDSVSPARTAEPRAHVVDLTSSMGEFVEEGRGGGDPPEVDPSSACVLLPTSGSTGLAKCCMVSHQGLLAHVDDFWPDNSPRRVLLYSSATWMTWWDVVTSALSRDVTLVSADMASATDTVRILQDLQVEWTLSSPALAARFIGDLHDNGTSTLLGTDSPTNTLDRTQKPGQLPTVPTLHTWILTGSDAHVALISSLQELMPNGWVRQGYGMTELAGFFCVPKADTPMASCGKPLPIFHFKINDDKGKELGRNQKGELYIKSDICVTKGYYKNETETQNTISPDGWLRTGDVFYQDDDDNMYFVERKKFWFKVNNYQVSPEEVEALVGRVEGVRAVYVGPVRGPRGEGAAALVAGEGVRAGDVRRSVAGLSAHKQLSDVLFVTSLPLTRSGKLRRADCQRLMDEMLAAGRGE